MKWGVRKKYRNADGSLNDKGIEKYARKGYAKDSLNDTVGGKIRDIYTGAHRINGDAKYSTSSKARNRARAEKYLSDRSANKAAAKKKAAKTAIKGANATAKVMSKVGTAYLSDQIFFGGVGTKMAKSTVKYAGRAAVTAFMKARGAWDIRWYDNGIL